MIKWSSVHFTMCACIVHSFLSKLNSVTAPKSKRITVANKTGFNILTLLFFFFLTFWRTFSHVSHIATTKMQILFWDHRPMNALIFLLLNRIHKKMYIISRWYLDTFQEMVPCLVEKESLQKHWEDQRNDVATVSEKRTRIQSWTGKQQMKEQR